jgi:branched-chain amino acid transport system permease protein
MIGTYHIVVGILLGIYIVLALSLNIITGYTGQPSLGHAAFFGIGAYSSAILSTRYHLSFWVAFPLSGFFTAIVGSMMGVLSLRVKEDFLAITTIGINFVVVAIFLYSDFFGGAFGIGGIPAPIFFGYKFTKPAYLVFVTGLVLLTILISSILLRSWLGLALEAIREDEFAAETMGIDTKKFKIVAFTIGTGLAGLAGSIYAHFMTFISPGDFSFPLSITIISMIVIGGIGTIRGAILGAIILGLAPEIFRPILEYRSLLYGGLLVLMMRFQPNGLLGHESFLLRRISLIRKQSVEWMKKGSGNDAYT